jgi:hypothetical protein
MLRPRLVGPPARFSVVKAAVTRLLGFEVWVVDWLVQHPSCAPVSPGRLQAPRRKPSVVGIINECTTW